MNVRTMGALVLLSAGILAGCSGHKIALENGNKVTKGDISVWASWIKDKGKKFDVQLNIQNSKKNDVIVMLGDMNCSRGGVTGMLKHTLFNTGEKTIDLRGGQVKSFNMVCDYQTKTQGDYKIVITRVFDNPGSDGKTKGAIIVKDIEWMAREASE